MRYVRVLPGVLLLACWGCGRIGYDDYLAADASPSAAGRLDAARPSSDGATRTGDSFGIDGTTDEPDAPGVKGDSGTKVDGSSPKPDGGFADSGGSDRAKEATGGDATGGDSSTSADAAGDAALDASSDAAKDSGGPQCTATPFCGDGANGTVLNSSYVCTAGAIGAVTACAFGCDGTTGDCSDLVPANQAAAHLRNADKFTCTGTQSAALPDIIAAAGDTIVFDTDIATVFKNGTAMAGVLWGAAYTPTSGTTTVVVAHVKSLQLTAGATVSVVGVMNALALLVDKDVAIAGGGATPASHTLIDLSAHYNSAMPPAPTFTGPGASFAMKS